MRVADGDGKASGLTSTWWLTGSTSALNWGEQVSGSTALGNCVAALTLKGCITGGLQVGFSFAAAYSPAAWQLRPDLD